jgi:hypothetical protein
MAPIFSNQSPLPESGRSREQDVEGRAAARLAFHGDGPLMLQDDAPRDGQAQASAIGFGGEEGLEQVGQVSRRDAGTIVFHRDPELSPARGAARLG